MEDDCDQGEPIADEPREDAEPKKRAYGTRSGYSPPTAYRSSGRRVPNPRDTPDPSEDWD